MYSFDNAGSDGILVVDSMKFSLISIAQCDIVNVRDVFWIV